MSKSNSASQHDTIGRILSYLVAITTIIGIPAGLYAYYAGEHAKRVERTFEFYENFRSEAFQQRWSLLENRWNEKANEVKSNLEKRDYAQLRLLAASIVQDKEGSAAFAQVVMYFDGLYACIENSLCDHNASVILFKGPASDFFGAFGSYILRVRDNFKNKDYAVGVTKINEMEKTWSVF